MRRALAVVLVLAHIGCGAPLADLCKRWPDALACPSPSPSSTGAPTPNPTPPPRDCRTLGCPDPATQECQRVRNQDWVCVQRPEDECGNRCEEDQICADLDGTGDFKCVVQPSPPPTPRPTATPGRCPAFTRVHCGKLNDQVPGIITFNSTHGFVTERGAACDPGHESNCGGRRCQDPRGTDWSVISGGEETEGEDNPFLFRVRITGDPVVVKCCPFPDPKDEAGVPMPGTPACSTASYP